MFAFNETDAAEARVTIDPTRQSEFAIPREYFGKFTEVLGRNTYHGFWAQVLENPSLEPIAGCLKNEAGNPKMDLAWSWQPWNGQGVAYALVDDAINTHCSQRIEVRAVPEGAAGAGIRQPVHLPIHRERRYELSFYAKEATAPLVAFVCVAGRPAQVLAQITLDPGEGAEWRRISATLELDLTPVASAEHPPLLWLCLGLAAPGGALLDQVLLWPADNVDGFDPDVIDALRDYHVTLLRFPGGNYVSGYHWKDGLGTLDERPTMPNPAWNNCDPHHVGTDEHIRLCRLISADPMICVNAGDGTAQEAADWVEYCNGSADTRWGKVRGERGHPEPFDVRYWEIGNEIYGSWQVGHCSGEEYAERYGAFREAMLAVDPDLHIIACGHVDWDINTWARPLFERYPDALESFSLHFLFSNSVEASSLASYLSQMGYTHHFEEVVRHLDTAAREHGASPRFAATEIMEIGRGLPYQPHPATQAEALFFAGSFNSFVRTEGMVELITYSALLNHGAGLRKQSARVYMTPMFFARRAMHALVGSRPLAFQVSCPFADVPEWQAGWAGPEPRRFPLVDVMPVLGDDALRIVLLNRDPRRELPVSIDLGALPLAGEFTLFELAADTFMSENTLFEPDRVQPVTTQHPTPAPGEPLLLIPPPASVQIMTLPLAK